mmetsp:Transcript_27266/g.78472  ORF Transcript_27266/g.78472 Transcript_27266/m.78472 type:complete len:199 (-) Transcript_27266:115-711(-)
MHPERCDIPSSLPSSGALGVSDPRAGDDGASFSFGGKSDFDLVDDRATFNGPPPPALRRPCGDGRESTIDLFYADAQLQQLPPKAWPARSFEDNAAALSAHNAVGDGSASSADSASAGEIGRRRRLRGWAGDGVDLSKARPEVLGIGPSSLVDGGAGAGSGKRPEAGLEKERTLTSDDAGTQNSAADAGEDKAGMLGT